MVCVLALDCATTTGWALWKTGMAKPRAGVITMPSTEDMGEFGDAFLEWMIPFGTMERLNHVVIEAPIISLHRGDGFGAPKINLNVVRRTLSCVSFAEYGARKIGKSLDWQVSCSETNRMSVAKHFTGVGGGPGVTRKQLKRACLVRCQHMGWNVKSEDIADALATLDHYLFNAEIDGVPWDYSPREPLFAGVAK